MNERQPSETGPNNPRKLPPAPPPNNRGHNAVSTAFIAACFLLALILWRQHHQHSAQAQQWSQTAVNYSNQVATLSDKLARQVAVNATLETNLDATRLKASNDIASIEATLSNTSSDLEKAREEAKAAETAASEKDTKIAALVNQNADLDKQSDDLRTSLTNLEAQIQSTRKKLDTAEGDKKLLLAELSRLQAQKDDLEAKLSDLAYLKETVRKLKDELAISRRLDWIRRGIYAAISEKGGERLIHPLALSPPGTNNALNVELRQNGGVKINPGPAGQTSVN